MPRFIVGAAAFAKALALVTPALVNKPVVPILENVKLECQATPAGYELLLSCSDLETTLRTRLQVEALEEWQLCVPAKMLLDTLRGLPDQPVTCTADPGSYRFEVKAARSRYTLTGENAADFPRQPVVEAQPLALPASTLRAALLALLPTVHTDYSQASRMCGVHFETNAGAIVAAASTDGHRLNQYTFAPGPASPGFTVPTKPIGLLAALLEADGNEPVRLLADQSSIALADGRWSARLIDERYPNYRDVVPVSNPLVAVVDRDELMSALRRLKGYANETTQQVRFDFGANELKLRAENLDFANDGSEEVTCQYAGEPLAIGFTAHLVLAQLKVLPAGALRLTMSTPNRAWLATADEDKTPLVTLCMPVMLNNYV